MESHMMPVKISTAGCPSLLLDRVITLFPSHGLLPPTELRKGSPGLLPVGYIFLLLLLFFSSSSSCQGFFFFGELACPAPYWERMAI